MKAILATFLWQFSCKLQLGGENKFADSLYIRKRPMGDEPAFFWAQKRYPLCAAHFGFLFLSPPHAIVIFYLYCALTH
jgi:hypothetical protein